LAELELEGPQNLLRWYLPVAHPSCFGYSSRKQGRQFGRPKRIFDCEKARPL